MRKNAAAREPDPQPEGPLAGHQTECENHLWSEGPMPAWDTVSVRGTAPVLPPRPGCSPTSPGAARPLLEALVTDSRDVSLLPTRGKVCGGGSEQEGAAPRATGRRGRDKTDEGATGAEVTARRGQRHLRTVCSSRAPPRGRQTRGAKPLGSRTPGGRGAPHFPVRRRQRRREQSRKPTFSEVTDACRHQPSTALGGDGAQAEPRQQQRPRAQERTQKVLRTR